MKKYIKNLILVSSLFVFLSATICSAWMFPARFGIWQSQKSFTCGVSSVSYGGESYPTVAIGTQCWLAKNMNIGTYVTGATTQTNNSVIEKYCYGDNTANCTTYGGLYQWNEAMQYSTTPGAQGICPAGWHIPVDNGLSNSSNEWWTLENYLKDSGQTCNATRSDWDCNTAGTKLKSGGTSGFNGLLAGYRHTSGSFYTQGLDTYLCSSLASGSLASYRYLYSGNSAVARNSIDKAIGFSVRCIKD